MNDREALRRRIDGLSPMGVRFDCAYNGDTAAARVLLDRSDAKITVKQWNLRSGCDAHNSNPPDSPLGCQSDKSLVGRLCCSTTATWMAPPCRYDCVSEQDPAG